MMLSDTVILCLLKLIFIISTTCGDDGCSLKIDETVEPMKTSRRSSCINGKKFVMVMQQQVNWYKAAHICLYNGMRFASIESPEEQSVLNQLLDQSGLTTYDGFWTSGNNLGCQTEWYWLSNGNPMKYFNWTAGEPNNFGNNERCMHVMWKSNRYQWNDCDCSVNGYFICEEEDCGCNEPKVELNLLQ